MPGNLAESLTGFAHQNGRLQTNASIANFLPLSSPIVIGYILPTGPDRPLSGSQLVFGVNLWVYIV